MKYCSVCNQKFDDTISFCPKDGEVLEEDPGSLVGNALDGQYQIEALLGKGGMGAVYLARHILLGDRVAIKIPTDGQYVRTLQNGCVAFSVRARPRVAFDIRTPSPFTIFALPPTARSIS